LLCGLLVERYGVTRLKAGSKPSIADA